MNRSFEITLLLLLVAASCVTTRAYAQQTAPAEPLKPTEEKTAVQKIEPIIVTGTKRETTFLQSDLSVTVLDAVALDEARVRDIRRLDDLVPNVQFNQTGQLGGTFISIRGVESNPYVVNRAAVYIDGIPFRQLSNVVLNQVESVEVLRGPQSTLYGANSEAGLVLIRSRQPSRIFEAEVRTSFSRFSSGRGGEVDGFIGGPLAGPGLLGSLSFVVSKEDAYIRNPASSIGEPGKLREGFLQGGLQWRPSSETTVNATAYVLNSVAPGLFEQEYAPLDRALYDATYGEFNGGRRVGRFEFLNDAPKRTEKTELVTGVSLAHKVASGQIDAALAYRREKSDSRGIDLDLTALPTAAGRDKENETVSSAELRFTSPANDRFQWLAGLSAYRETSEQFLGTAIGPAGLDSFLLSPPQSAKGTDSSAFGSATWGLPIEGLSLTGGLRYERATRATQQRAGELNLGPVGTLIFRDVSLEETFTAVLPRLSLKYSPAKDQTYFVTAAKGYIPGGFNLTAAQENLVDQVVRYGSESLWSYELGFKRGFSKGYIAGALFHVRSDSWQEVQVLTDDQGRVASSAFIAARAGLRSSGFELEGAYRPTDRLNLTASLGYTNATYRNLPGVGAENLGGNRVKLIPRYDANVAARYRFDGGWFASAEVNATGSIALNERNTATQKAVALVNLQFGYEGDRFSARMFAENIGNKRVFNGLAYENFGFGSDGNFYAPLDAPRIVGLEVKYGF